MNRRLMLILWAFLSGANFACVAWDAMRDQYSAMTLLNGVAGIFCVLKAVELTNA